MREYLICGGSLALRVPHNNKHDTSLNASKANFSPPFALQISQTAKQLQEFSQFLSHIRSHDFRSQHIALPRRPLLHFQEAAFFVARRTISLALLATLGDSADSKSSPQNSDAERQPKLIAENPFRGRSPAPRGRGPSYLHPASKGTFFNPSRRASCNTGCC